MSNYGLIEHELFRIDAARFQKVCAYYLTETYPGEPFTPGGMEDKDKTRTGRPDFYIALENGKFILAEITTHDDLDHNGYSAKLKKDLLSCLDTAVIGIELKDISRIILCTNGTVELPLRKELSAIAAHHSVPLTIVGFNRLVTFFYHTGKLFAKDFLGIPFITGQVLNKAEFLRQYGHSGVATPLDNALYGREKEMELLLPLLTAHEVVLITGKPGVGKSRLALAVIDRFLLENTGYQAYYILTKPETITEDLLMFIKQGHNYILFIDDANRQLESLLPVLSRARDQGVSMKLVLTVRGYAQKEVERHLTGHDFVGVIVPLLEEDIVHRILYHPPFDITAAEVRALIVKISKGNARLAIMAAKIFKEHNDPEMLKDATAIYEGYFRSVIDDKNFAGDPENIKVLGLLSFFESLDTDEENALAILSDFGIELQDYNRCIQLLEGLELVEIRYHTIAKISDQVLGTYFFYLTFIERRLLSPVKLVSHYFTDFSWRMKETFLPAIMTFGEKNVLGTSPDFLLDYLNTISADNYAQVRFFEIFGLYLSQQLFVFINGIIKHAPPGDTEFDFGNVYKNSQPAYHAESLRLLEPFYEGEHSDFLTAIGLAFRYVDKNRGSLDTLIHQVTKYLYAGGEELNNGFKKLTALYDYLLPKLEVSDAYKVLFYYGMQHALLNTSFNYALYEERDGRVWFKPSFGELRSRFWREMNLNFKRDRVICYDLLIEYLATQGQNNEIYLEADQPLIAALIAGNFRASGFEDTYFVQEYINVLIDHRVRLLPEMKDFQRRFRNADYSVIRNLSTERDGKRRLFRLRRKFSDYWNQQVKQVKSKFNIATVADFDRMQAAVLRYNDFKYRHRLDVSTGFHLVLEQVFEQDIELGFAVLASYLEKGNGVGFNPIRLFNSIFNIDPAHAERLYQTISSFGYQDKSRWLEGFFEYLPPEAISELFLERLYEHFRDCRSHYELHVGHYRKYEQFREGTIKNLTTILYHKRLADADFQYKLELEFFKKYPYLRDSDLPLAKELYIQQQNMDASYDPRASDLLYLMEKDVHLFTEFIDLRIERYKKYYTAPKQYLTGVWVFPEAETLVYETLLKISGVKLSGLGMEDFGAVLFIQLNPEFQAPGLRVLARIINEFSGDSMKLNMVWNILRNFLRDYYAGMIQLWLSFNDDMILFKKMDWTNHSFDYANGIPAQQRIGAYQFVMDTVKAMPDTDRYVEQLAYLAQLIGFEHRQTEIEKRRIYRGLW